MVEVDAEAFGEMVDAEFDALPDEMVRDLDNVAIFVEDLPEDGSMDLLGLYHGVAVTDRGQYGFGELPDTISIYRLPLCAVADDEEQLRDQIHVTLVHEIAHYYGLSDDELHDLGWA